VRRRLSVLPTRGGAGVLSGRVGQTLDPIPRRFTPQANATVDLSILQAAAERGAVYPVGPDKRHYMKIGAAIASQLAPKLAAIEAAGFRAGRRHRLTVVDIDSPTIA
jgi:hypothetical protein